MDFATIILYTHIGLTSTFLFFFLFKTILLLMGKKELLDKIRKYKMIDMIWGLLIVGTGAYLWYATSEIYGHRMWLDVKVLLVVIAIVLGIISMRKENKIMAIIALLLLIYVYGVAETKSLKFKQDKKEAAKEKIQEAGNKIKNAFD